MSDKFRYWSPGKVKHRQCRNTRVRRIAYSEVDRGSQYITRICSHGVRIDAARDLTYYSPAMQFGNRKGKYFKGCFFVQYCQNLEKQHPFGNLKFNNLGIFLSLKFRTVRRKILRISPQLNFIPNNLGCYGLRIFQRNGLKLDKDLVFSGLVQNVYVYRMAKSKKIWPFRLYAFKFSSREKMHGLLWQLRKMARKLLNYDW